MILGKNLILTVGDESRGLAASKSCDLSIDTDFIEVCSPVNGSWKDYLPTINSWSASVDMLVASLSDHKALLKKQDNKEKLMCCFFDTDLQEFYKGYCYIKGLQIKGTIGGLATMGVTLQPTGKLDWAEEHIQQMAAGNTQTISGRYIEPGVLGVHIRQANGRSVILNELTISKDTRISLPNGYALINADLTTTAGYLNDGSGATTTMSAAAIAYNNSGAEKAVVVKEQSREIKVTVVANVVTKQKPYFYLSKF